jgi:hypothetical protein
MFRVRSERLAVRLLLVGGCVQAAIALMHFAMPATLLQGTDFAPLSPAAHDYVVLATVAVGILALALGAFSFVAAMSVTRWPGGARLLAIILAAVWTGRFVIEIIWPLRLRLFFIDAPSPLILAGSIVLVGLFAAAAVNAEPRQAR